jgi:hypothetical protein
MDFYDGESLNENHENHPISTVAKANQGVSFILGAHLCILAKKLCPSPEVINLSP